MLTYFLETRKISYYNLKKSFHQDYYLIFLPFDIDFKILWGKNMSFISFYQVFRAQQSIIIAMTTTNTNDFDGFSNDPTSQTRTKPYLSIYLLVKI